MRELKTILSHAAERITIGFALLFLFVLLSLPAVGIPRIVQTAGAQTPDTICPPTAAPCNSTPDQLTISFSPTVAGDALALMYVGSFNDFTPFARTCTDSRGQQWIPVILFGSNFGESMYFPPAGSITKGLT